VSFSLFRTVWKEGSIECALNEGIKKRKEKGGKEEEKDGRVRV
jgi:hypothetical protein